MGSMYIQHPISILTTIIFKNHYFYKKKTSIPVNQLNENYMIEQSCKKKIIFGLIYINVLILKL